MIASPPVLDDNFRSRHAALKLQRPRQAPVRLAVFGDSQTSQAHRLGREHHRSARHLYATV